jgi:hypothetical protein
MDSTNAFGKVPGGEELKGILARPRVSAFEEDRKMFARFKELPGL